MLYEVITFPGRHEDGDVQDINGCAAKENEQDRDAVYAKYHTKNNKVKE